MGNITYAGIDILIAVLLDFILGDPVGFPHPVIYIGKLISFLEEKGRKVCDNPRKLRLLGLFIVLMVSLFSFGIPYALLWLMKPYFWGYRILNIGILWTTLAATSLRKEGLKVYDSLLEEDIKESRIRLSYIVGRDTSNLNKEEIIRADVETIAENTSDGIIAPIIYIIIGGTPLGVFYKAINTMDSMVGYKNEKYLYFGRFAAKLDDVLNYIPARISAYIMIVASFFSKMNGKNAYKIYKRDRYNHSSPNSAHTEAVCAGALEVELAGDAYYFGKLYNKKTIGDALRKIEYEDIRRSNLLLYVTSIISIILFSVIKSIILYTINR